jgi:hypothetical protein
VTRISLVTRTETIEQSTDSVVVTHCGYMTTSLTVTGDKETLLRCKMYDSMGASVSPALSYKINSQTTSCMVPYHTGKRHGFLDSVGVE